MFVIHDLVFIQVTSVLKRLCTKSWKLVPSLRSNKASVGIIYFSLNYFNVLIFCIRVILWKEGWCELNNGLLKCFTRYCFFFSILLVLLRLVLSAKNQKCFASSGGGGGVLQHAENVCIMFLLARLARLQLPEFKLLNQLLGIRQVREWTLLQDLIKKYNKLFQLYGRVIIMSRHKDFSLAIFVPEIVSIQYKMNIAIRTLV